MILVISSRPLQCNFTTKDLDSFDDYEVGACVKRQHTLSSVGASLKLCGFTVIIQTGETTSFTPWPLRHQKCFCSTLRYVSRCIMGWVFCSKALLRVDQRFHQSLGRQNSLLPFQSSLAEVLNIEY